MAKFRVGVIGVGWGAVVHVPAFRAVDEFEVVALCSRRLESVTEAGEKLGIADVSADWRSFVRRDDLDVISVTAPVNEHVPISLAALEAGKHVLCEKPAATTASEAWRLVDAADGSDQATAMGFEKRWLSDNYAIWDLVRNGFVGTPYFIRFTERSDYMHPTHAPMSPWMYRREDGGGFLMGAQSHHLDFILKMFGEPESVCADVKVTAPRREMADGVMIDVDADDTANVLVRLKSGASVIVSTSMVGVHTKFGLAIEIFGSDGAIVMDWDGQVSAGKADGAGLEPVALVARPLKSGVDLGRGRSASRIRATAHLLEEWLPALHGRPAPDAPSFRDGWLVQRVIDGAWESSDGAGWVKL